jgi:hypothetical protein
VQRRHIQAFCRHHSTAAPTQPIANPPLDDGALRDSPRVLDPQARRITQSAIEPTEFLEVGCDLRISVRPAPDRLLGVADEIQRDEGVVGSIVPEREIQGQVGETMAVSARMRSELCRPEGHPVFVQQLQSRGDRTSRARSVAEGESCPRDGAMAADLDHRRDVSVRPSQQPHEGTRKVQVTFIDSGVSCLQQKKVAFDMPTLGGEQLAEVARSLSVDRVACLVGGHHLDPCGLA